MQIHKFALVLTLVIGAIFLGINALAVVSGNGWLLLSR
jgi:hypothetical protein